MGFWSTFFGVGAANIYRDIKKEQEKSIKWNDDILEVGKYETEFGNYLTSIGCKDIYIVDTDYIERYGVSASIKQIQDVRKKVNEYLALGGKGDSIVCIYKMDDYIEKVKYLKERGILDRQDEFAFDDFAEMLSALEQEEKNTEVSENIQLLNKIQSQKEGVQRLINNGREQIKIRENIEIEYKAGKTIKEISQICNCEEDFVEKYIDYHLK